MEFLGKNTIKLCRKGSCCPIVDRVDEDQFTITDDYKGKVTLTKDQMDMLKEAIDHLSKE